MGKTADSYKDVYICIAQATYMALHIFRFIPFSVPCFSNTLFCNACSVNLILNKPSFAVYFGHFFNSSNHWSYSFRSQRLSSSECLVSESESLEKTRLTNHDLFQNLGKPRFEVYIFKSGCFKAFDCGQTTCVT